MHDKPADLTSLNDHILEIDLDDLSFETLDQRLELSLVALFDVGAPSGELGSPAEPGCGQFSCNGYWPNQAD